MSVRSTRLVAMLLCALGAAVAAADFTIRPILIEGDDVAGVGLVTRIDAVAVNNTGVWLVEADTDNPDTMADGVMVRNGDVLLRENDALSAPAGAAVSSFDSINLNNAGQAGWNLFLRNLPSNQDSGIFINDQLVIQESFISTAPQFSPGTPYIGFFDVKFGNSNRLFSVASVDDPAIATTVDRALVDITVDGNGALESERVIAKEGDILPGQNEAVSDFGTGPHDSAWNDAGQALYSADLTGDTAFDGVVYLDQTLLAQEGFPSPVAARDWAALSSPKVGLNRFGQYVHSGRLASDTSDDTVIVGSAGVVVREGQPVPGLESFAFAGFGSGPVQISDQGRVLYYGDWNDPNTAVDEGLFLDEVLLVQEGATNIDGLRVDTLRGVSDGYAMSPNGRYIVFRCVLTDGRDAAFLIELDACADLDDSGAVDLSDLATLLAAFGACSGDAAYNPEADLDFSGCLDLSDLATMLANFGGSCG